MYVLSNALAVFYTVIASGIYCVVALAIANLTRKPYAVSRYLPAAIFGFAAFGFWHFTIAAGSHNPVETYLFPAFYGLIAYAPPALLIRRVRRSGSAQRWVREFLHGQPTPTPHSAPHTHE